MLAVKILSDAEFDRLPYPEARISLGLADTQSGQAYVRYTHSDELNKYLVSHELEHLLGQDRDEIHHGGNGVYYKGFGNIFSALQGAGQSLFGGAQKVGEGIAGAGRSVMGMFGGGQPQPTPKLQDPAMQGMAKNAGRMGAQGSLASLGANNPSYRAPQGMMANQLFEAGYPMNMSALKDAKNPLIKQPTSTQGAPPSSPQVSMPQPMTQKPPQANVMANFQFPQSSVPAGTQTIKSATGAPMSSVNIGGSPPPMTPVSSFSQGMPNIVPTSRPGTPPPPVDTPSVSGKGATQGKDAMSMFKNPQQALLGAGLEGIGQFGIQTPNMPDISELPSVQSLRNFNFNSVGELDPALEQAINNDFQRIEQREYEAFVSRYKSLRPGADIESDSMFKRDLFELQRMQGSRRADALAKYRFEMIQQNLQISQAELAQLQGIAQMDVDMIMGQMGLDYADAQKFKDTFSRLGDTLITEGLGIGQGQEQEEPISA